MKTLTPTSIATGLIAGVTAALLSLSATAQSALAIVLYAASALPILIAGLGWGNAIALIAVLAGGATVSILASPSSALIFAITTLIPAGWLSNIANLARPASELGGPEDALAWYPLSNILVHLAVIVTLGLVAVGVIVGYDSAMVGQLVDAIIVAMKAQEPLFHPDAAIIAQWKASFFIAMPVAQGASQVFLLFAAYYLATRIVRLSGKGLRPREDMPSTLRMHRNAIFIFLAGLLLTFTGGAPALIGALVCGTFGAGFVLAGFANLHFKTRGKPWRPIALWFVYLAVFLLVGLPLFAFVILGMLDTRRTIALTPTGPADNKNQNI